MVNILPSVPESKPVAILTDSWYFRLGRAPKIISRFLPKNEDILLIEALKKRKIHAEHVVWNQPKIDWKKYQAFVVRSTWDYHKSKESVSNFLATLKGIDLLQIPILNPRSTLEWNIDKTYLKKLSERGVPIVDTIWLKKKDLASLEMVIKTKGWSDCVIKPVISASGMHTRKFHAKEAAKMAMELSSLDIDRWMVQPFMSEIVEEGEKSFIFIQNKFSHCVLKKPSKGSFLVQGGTVNKIEPSADLIKQAEKMLTLANQETLYARVDVIQQKDKLRLMELELIEPALYLHLDEKAADRFAAAISSALNHYSRFT